MRIRTADLSDLKEIARVEAACFPAAEAATEEEFEKRLTFYKDHFWLMFEEEKLIAFVDGMVTNQEDLTDEMYEKAEMHDEKGDWQMIFGVNTLPSYRKHGYAERLQMQKSREERDLSLPARTGCYLIMPGLDSKMKVSQNQYMETWSGIR